METFRVTVDKPLAIERGKTQTWYTTPEVRVRVSLPAGVAQEMSSDGPVKIDLPDGEDLPEPTTSGNQLTYEFPAKCTIERPAVPRFSLACVIALAVAGICLWGTLTGSMLPLIFKRLGVDPGIASSPFVATFVDVTGIVIYFNIARVILAEFLA
jgi:magnesium transporter